MRRHKGKKKRGSYSPDALDGVEVAGEGAGCLADGLGCSLPLIVLALVGLPWMP